MHHFWGAQNTYKLLQIFKFKLYVTRFLSSWYQAFAKFIHSYCCKSGIICFHLVTSFTTLQVVSMAIIQGVRYKLLRPCGHQLVHKLLRVDMRLISSLLALSALLQDVTKLFQASALKVKGLSSFSKRGSFCFIIFFF